MRILNELPPPFKAESYETKLKHMVEVEDLKQHLASSNLSVSADVIYKAISFPEDFEAIEANYISRVAVGSVANTLKGGKTAVPNFLGKQGEKALGAGSVERRFYPKVGDLLIVNPFAKPKKAKKGKKKKK